MNFGSYTPEEAANHKPSVIVLNEKNEVVRYDALSLSNGEFKVIKNG